MTAPDNKPTSPDDDPIGTIICSLPDGFMYGDSDFTRVKAALAALTRKASLHRAIEENMRWLEHCKLPDFMKAVDSVKVTDLIARNSELQAELQQLETKENDNGRE